MRENEFERNVQEQMEELRIRPSDETWERVEKELREKKKRRAVVLFFIMAGLLLLGYSGYTFLNNSSYQPVAKNELKKSSAETTQPTNNTSTTATTTAGNNNNSAVAPETTPINSEPGENRNANPSIQQETIKEDPVLTEQAHREKNRQLPARINSGKPGRADIVKEYAADQKQRKNAGTGQKENDPVISNSDERAIVNKPLGQTEKKPVQQPENKNDDIISNSIATTTDKNEKQRTTDSAAIIDSTVAKTDINKMAAQVTEDPKPAIAKNNNKSKIRFGVEVSGGFISSQNKIFGFSGANKNKSLLDFQSSYGGAVNNPGTGTNTSGITPPSPVRGGNFWKIGLIAEKTITKRSSLSAGLRYTYADESLKVGAITNTVVRSNSYSFAQNFYAASGVRSAFNYYAFSQAAAPGRPVEYTNRYHFLEIPLLFQTQLNKGKKMGILWNAGIAPGFLIGTNALVYDTAARGVYYTNDNAFKKFHFNMETGFSLQFGSNKKIQWSVGPALSLDMSRLMKQDVFTDKRYFLYSGITGRVFLNSRKK